MRSLQYCNLVYLCILLPPIVNGQWQHDNRCFGSNRLLSEELGHSSNMRMTTEELEKIIHKNNVTARSNNGEYWYNNLRGPGSGRRSLANEIKPTEEHPSAFMLKLHFQEDNCWQGEKIERRWCIECESGSQGCKPGDKLLTQFCDNSPSQKFVWIPNVDIPDETQNFGQLKLAHFDLCIERMTINTYAFQACSDTAYQTLVGWHPSQPFELHPVEDNNKCINQHHHPRPAEEIANTFCDKAEKFHTNLWEVYLNENADKEITRLRTPQCSEESPCKKCIGDCDNDNQVNSLLGLACLDV